MSTPSAVPQTLDRGVLTILAVLAALFAVYANRLADPDLWGHLMYGQLFLRDGPNIKDPFAYTTTGKHWSTHEYLSQMILALAYGIGGPLGLLVLKCLLGGAAIACLYASLRTSSAEPRVWAPLLMLSAMGLGRWYQFRPQLFTYLFFAAYVLVLFRYLLGKPRMLWLLPLLMPLWVNLHGGFLAGLGAVGLALAGRLLQTLQRHGWVLKKTWSAVWPLLVTLVACLLGTLCNPLGWKLYPYLRTEFGHADNGRYLQEWQPVPLTDYWTVFLFGIILVLLFLLTVLAQRRTQRIADLAPGQWLLSCLPLAFMALMSQRHIPIFTIWATPVLGLLAQAAFAAAPERSWQERTWFGITGVITLATMMMFAHVLQDPRPGIIIDGPALGNKHPHGVMVFLKKHKLTGDLFTPLWWGSYFTWELYPYIKVSMDGRNVTLFDPKDVTDNLVFYHEADADLGIPLRSYARYVVVPADAADGKLLPRLRQDPHWLLAYEDDQASLFVRSSEAEQAELDKWRQQPLTEAELAIPHFLR